MAENVHLGAQPVNRFGLDRLAGDAARGSRASGEPRDRRRSALPHGRPAARAAATGGSRAGAVFRCAHHHPGRADLGACATRGGTAVRAAAPAARRRQKPRLHLAFSRRRAGDLRPGDGVSQRPNGGDRGVRACRQALGDRPDDRRRPRGTGGELPGRHSVAQPAGCEGGADGRGAEPSGRVSRRVAAGAGAARCWGSTGSSGRGSSNWPARCSAAAGGARADDAGRARGAAVVDDAGAAGGNGVRAGEPPDDAVRRRAGVQERDDRDAGPHRPPLAAAQPSSARSLSGMSSGCASGRRMSARALGLCPAATSRRSRWRSG